MSAHQSFTHPEREPLDVVLSVIPSLPRALLARLVERAIECLDDMDGDPDVEPNGDETDHSGGEDDCDPTCERIRGLGPGCPLSEPGEIIAGCGRHTTVRIKQRSSCRRPRGLIRIDTG